MRLLLVLLLIACAVSRPPLPVFPPLRPCPIGQQITPLADPIADGCVDARGETWSSCAWNHHVACEAL